MDLVRDLGRATTHFFALTLRRHPTETNPRKFYSLVDAAVLPLSLLEEKFKHTANAATDQPVSDYIRGVQYQRDQLMRDGALSTMVALFVELGPDEEKTVEEAVRDVSAFTIK
jgi:uncharacterized protein YaeQ